MSGSGKEFYYDVLDVAQNASAEDIRKAYCWLSLMCHPDKQNQAESSITKEEALARYQEIQEAYQVLSDPVKRAVYDAGLNARKHCCGDTWSYHHGSATMVAQEPVNMHDLQRMTKRGSSGQPAATCGLIGPAPPQNGAVPYHRVPPAVQPQRLAAALAGRASSPP